MLPSNRKQAYFKQCKKRGERNKVTSKRSRLKGDIAGHAGWVIQTGVVVTSVCQNCGSRRFRADRSMAGRLVCQVCGLAAGSRANRTTIRPSGRFRQKRWRWLVGLVIVVILIAVVMG